MSDLQQELTPEEENRLMDALGIFPPGGNVRNRYRKRPVVVYAEQFFSDRPLPFRHMGPIVEYENGRYYVITAHDQRAYLADGDWVILESRGLFRAYPCKPDIFEATYEPEPTP